MFRILLIFVVLLSGCYSINRLEGYQEVEQLSTSLLLVQLEFPQQQIDLLKEMGFENRATRLRNKHERHHNKLAKAFNSFSFCPYYFYYSDPDTVNVFDEDLKLYNDGLILSKFRLQDKQYFVAQFTAKLFDDGLDFEEIKEGLQLYKADGGLLSNGFPDFVPMTNYGSEEYYNNTIRVLDKRLFIFQKEYTRFKRKQDARKERKIKRQSREKEPRGKEKQ